MEGDPRACAAAALPLATWVFLAPRIGPSPGGAGKTDRSTPAPRAVSPSVDDGRVTNRL